MNIRARGPATWRNSFRKRPANPTPNFAMFSAAGNRAVARLVASAVKKAQFNNERSVTAFITKRMKKIAPKHGEVYDTAVREAITWAIHKATGQPLISIFDV